MAIYDEIKNKWLGMLQKKVESSDLNMLENPDLSIGSYRSYLLETFFHTRENPFSQVRCASYFPRDQHDLFRKMVRHALSEVKHDLLALNDFAHVGGDPNLAITGKPLAATQALIDYTYQLADDPNPIRYLAYLYHVEHLPTTRGHIYLERLSQAGVPKEAMTFIEEHATVDVSHNKIMMDYITYFCRTSRDLDLFVGEFDRSMDMHFAMIIGAILRPLD